MRRLRGQNDDEMGPSNSARSTEKQTALLTMDDASVFKTMLMSVLLLFSRQVDQKQLEILPPIKA